VLQGFLYTRHNNPSRQILEKGLALLEDAKYGLCFSSGTSAISVIVQLLNAGEHIVSSEIIFGGTHRYFEKVRSCNDRQACLFYGVGMLQEQKLLGSVLTAPSMGQGFTT
jgi:O-acetylhomoserine/O-acetylserine sulfhydrylase-like pyridoxal-dependent enzyme